MKIVDNKTPIYNRRIILVDDLENHPNFEKTFSEKTLPEFKRIKNSQSNIDNTEAYDLAKKNILERKNEEGIIYLINADLDRKRQKSDISFVPINYSFENFIFPPQHPQKGIIYSCTDFEPNFYIPLSSFHQYSFNLKQSSFIEMCASLNAKEILLIDEIVDNVKTNLDAKIEIMESYNKLSAEFKLGEIKFDKTSFIFPKPNEKKIIQYESKWINCEPNWQTLQKLRIENNISEYTCELNYTDEMGVNIEMATKLKNNGLNIGGSFEKIKKIKREYKVVFWN
jgi:hypothetical protein